ncbi:MAG: ABC transporter ATP-binding protein [Phycisphaerae bacterium]|nr:ABC transporter ATP-binding protein [Phycisphaerae bacterium]
MTRLQIENLTRRFGPVTAVDDMSLVVEPGELFFLLGPSGCGKTTLLRMLAGFVAPDAGRILLGDEDVTDRPAHRRNCGMVFQNYALWPHLSVAENIAFGLRVRRLPAAQRRDRVEEMVSVVQLTGLADRRPAQLSGGQQQRVALARALAIKPALLLLDEPLSNLDAKLRIEMRTEIIRICRATGVTAVYVTHDQKEALSMADRLAVVLAGRIVQVGQPQEVYRRPANRFVADFIGRTNFIAATVQSADAAGLHLQTAIGQLVSKPGPSGTGILPVKSSTDILPVNSQGRPGPEDHGRDAHTTPVVCSLRPETIRLLANGQPHDGVNTFPADLVETVYLGEIAQHTLRLPDGTTLDAYELHPRFVGVAGQATKVFCQIDPADVQVLAE